MANMSYCRFQNTTSDFQDCVNAIEQERLSDLSSDERYAARRLYELAQEFIELYEAEEENEPESDDDEECDLPSENQEKVWFLAYYRVQMRGQFNMITECVQAANAAGLSMETYCYIQSNYSTFSRMYEEDCKKINEELMAEIYENE